MSFARLVLSTSSDEDMPIFKVNLLPQRHAITPLIQHYLENIHILYPFLSETKLFAAIDALYQENGRYASPLDHWVTRMVLAISYGSLSRRRGDTAYQDGVRQAAGAFEYIESVVHPGSVTGIQAMLLMVLYSMLDPHHFHSWYLIGLSSRAMVDIGMHQDPPAESRLRASDHDLGKRVFASVYALDRSVSTSLTFSASKHFTQSFHRSISMVHRRGFSFTDDSAGVTCSNRPTRPGDSSNSNQIFLRNLDTAVQIDQLRQTQSHAYQKLFQSNRPSLDDSWPLMSSTLEDMHYWSEGLPDYMNKSLKKLLQSDVLYSSILILLPPELVGTLCGYGTFLIFEYAVEYADLMVSIIEDQESFVFHTSNDILRASFVAERLIDILLDDSALLFSGVIPRAPPDSIPASGPSTIPARTIGEMVNRAHRCLAQLEKILEHLGPRYGYPEPLSDFKARSSDLRRSLQAIYDNWNRNLGVSRGQYVSSLIAIRR